MKKKQVKRPEDTTKLILHGIKTSHLPRLAWLEGFEILGKALINHYGIVEGENWHVEFYIKKDGDGMLLDEIRVSNIKR